MTTYCPDCGRATIYQGTKPNFCGFCKASLVIGESAASEPPRRTLARDDRRPARRREPEPEPQYDNEPDDYYDDEPRGRRSSLSHIKITLVDQDVKEKREPERLPVQMDQLFAGLGGEVANTGPVARPEELKDHSYSGGDKKTFAKNFLNQQVFSSARGKPVQEVG